MSFRTAKRTEAKPLIGIYSESGCGKTYSSLLLARGFVGPKGRIGMIETEAGRGEVFVGDPLIGEYLVRPIRENFASVEYGKAISEAEKEKLDALIIDSASHEWEGAGGVLGMAAERQAEGKKGPIVWQQPKMDHQRHFMLRLMQTPIPLVIVCMRAKYPMKETPKPGGGKEWSRSEILEPKQADDILFEMMVHAWIDQAHCLHVTKWTKEDFRIVFLDGKPITIDTGKRLARWASSATDQPAPPQPATPSGESSQPLVEQAAGADLITPDQVAELSDLILEAGIPKRRILGKAGVQTLALLSVEDYLDLKAMLNDRIRGKK